jgi:hypothetical protein
MSSNLNPEKYSLKYQQITKNGKLAERSKALAWKASDPDNGSTSSNLVLSANSRFEFQPCYCHKCVLFLL